MPYDLHPHAWRDFLQTFEKTDPEPKLKTIVKNRFFEGAGFATEDVDAHIAWHRRLSDAWALQDVDA